MARKGVSSEERSKRIAKINLAFPDAAVQNYESLIDKLVLPDRDDRHVLAAAIRINANLIVTSNLKDFPEAYLASFGLAAKGVDDFVVDMIDLSHDAALRAFRQLVLNRRNPYLDEYAVLEAFRRNGLVQSAHYLHALL